jgi:molybdenum cofactor biosynthesis enzyme MoaA
MSIHINLELTDHCNIKCKMCSQSMRDDAHGGPKKFMDWDTWRVSLHGLADLEEDVHLCPHWLGEPTIHPEFDKFVEYAFAINTGNRLFREFKLHTNAVVLSEQRAHLLLRLANASGQLEDTFRFIHFSVDAYSPAVYAEVKGSDKGELVRRNIERFLQIRDELQLEWPKVTLAYVVQPENADEAADFLAHWQPRLREPALTWDWPHELRDTIYFRALNCSDQIASDRLHAETCRAMGMDVPEGDRLRAAESF